VDGDGRGDRARLEARSLFTLVPIRPRRRCERRSLRTFSPCVSLRPGSLAFNPDTPRCLSTSRLTPFNSTPTFVALNDGTTLRHLAYSSITPIIHMVDVGNRETRRSVANITDIHDALHIGETPNNRHRERRFGIWCFKFAGDGATLVAGASDGAAYVHDVERDVSVHRLRRVLLTLVPIRPHSRGERRSLRTFSPGACFSPPRVPRFQRPTLRRLSTPSDAFRLHPDIVASYGTTRSGHVNDVNAVAWAEPGSSHVLYTGSDDCTCAVWDLRAPSDAARGGGPAGVLIGHTEVRPIHWSPYDRVGVVNADP
jgi:WD40 repeat protein